MSSTPAPRPNGFSEVTGEICYDLPSAYIPHQATGLLHLPRFIAKARKHIKGELPKSYQRNFCKGFDRFLCLHLGVNPEQVIECVRLAADERDLDARLLAIFPSDLRVHVWNREVVQKGLSEMGRGVLEEAKRKMGAEQRTDIITFADMIDFDEGRLS
ncbi:MAG: DUF5069 domain-containing protein [Verrucomicrobiota bacterium]|jgi:hypothetical protein